MSFGRFYRRSDSRYVRRFRCLDCKITFSFATHHPCFRQKKRQFNEPIRKMLVSGMSLRRISFITGLSRTTVDRKLKFLGENSLLKFKIQNQSLKNLEVIEFDEMETFEHTKCKPVSIHLAVEHKTRRVLSFHVGRMPAKGRLTKIAFKKYGKRIDERVAKRKLLLSDLKPIIKANCQFKSDENPHYPQVVREILPDVEHIRFKGQRGSIVGQGELKKVRFDPLFSLNHTCAMFRANVNRLFRRTWCTTKKIENLRHHLAIYAEFHNSELI